MISRRFAFPVLVLLFIPFASSAFATQSSSGALEVTFPNGIHLRVQTAQTGNRGKNHFTTELAVKSPGVVHRLFTDARNHLAFGYDIDAVPDNQPDQIKIDIKPLDDSVRSLLHEQKISAGSDDNSRIPTFDKEREIGPIRVGDTVSVEVLTNPTTGDKITDLIEVVAPAAQRSTIAPDTATAPRPTRFEFTDFRASLNGKELPSMSPVRSMSGAFPVLYIPGHGSFFIALEPYKDLPFLRAGTVSGIKLKFIVGSDSIECTSSAPILSDSAPKQIWVWHEANYKPTFPEFNSPNSQARQDSLQLSVADSIEVWRNLVKTQKRAF